jgi:hypothetical protein
MKEMLYALAFAIIAASNAFAANYKFECGNDSITVAPKTVEYDGYIYQSTYNKAGKDIQMVGEDDTTTVLTGSHADILHFTAKKNLNFRLFIVKTEKIGQVVPAKEYDLYKGNVKDMKCTLVSFSEN